MSTKHSKEVTDRIRSGDHLLSAFDVEGPRVAACFLDETRPHVEEVDGEPNPGGFLAAAGRKVRGSLDHLVKTDFAVARAEGLESVLRSASSPCGAWSWTSSSSPISRTWVSSP